VLLAGLTLAFVGLVLMARAPVDGQYLTDVLPAMAFIGVGIGIMFPALVTLAMAGVAPEDSGLASGLVNTSAQVGGALGLAILATIAAVRSAGLQAGGLQPAEALAGGFDLAFAVAAALFAVAILITVTVVRDSASDACSVPAELPTAQAA
jgi:MFS family permease